MQIRFSWPNGVENVSNMFQSFQNILINDRKYILDLYKCTKILDFFNVLTKVVQITVKNGQKRILSKFQKIQFFSIFKVS